MHPVGMSIPTGNAGFPLSHPSAPSRRQPDDAEDDSDPIGIDLLPGSETFPPRYGCAQASYLALAHSPARPFLVDDLRRIEKALPDGIPPPKGVHKRASHRGSVLRSQPALRPN